LSGTPSSAAKLFVGIPASEGAAASQSFIQPGDLHTLYDNVKDKPMFSGIMFWEAGESDTINDNGCTFAQSVKSVFTTGNSC
jgi:chitinase